MIRSPNGNIVSRMTHLVVRVLAHTRPICCACANAAVREVGTLSNANFLWTVASARAEFILASNPLEAFMLRDGRDCD
jgi:hypothetical protein